MNLKAEPACDDTSTASPCGRDVMSAVEPDATTYSVLFLSLFVGLPSLRLENSYALFGSKPFSSEACASNNNKKGKGEARGEGRRRWFEGGCFSTRAPRRHDDSDAKQTQISQKACRYGDPGHVCSEEGKRLRERERQCMIGAGGNWWKPIA